MQTKMPWSLPGLLLLVALVLADDVLHQNPHDFAMSTLTAQAGYSIIWKDDSNSPRANAEIAIIDSGGDCALPSDEAHFFEATTDGDGVVLLDLSSFPSGDYTLCAEGLSTGTIAVSSTIKGISTTSHGMPVKSFYAGITPGLASPFKALVPDGSLSVTGFQSIQVETISASTTLSLSAPTVELSGDIQLVSGEKVIFNDAGEEDYITRDGSDLTISSGSRVVLSGASGTSVTSSFSLSVQPSILDNDLPSVATDSAAIVEIQTTANRTPGNLPVCSVAGQMLIMSMTVDGGDYDLGGANICGDHQTFHFNDVGDTITLTCLTASGCWSVSGWYGLTFSY